MTINCPLEKSYFSISFNLSGYYGKVGLRFNSDIWKFSQIGNIWLVWEKSCSLMNYTTCSETWRVRKVDQVYFLKELKNSIWNIFKDVNPSNISESIHATGTDCTPPSLQPRRVKEKYNYLKKYITQSEGVGCGVCVKYNLSKRYQLCFSSLTRQN